MFAVLKWIVKIVIIYSPSCCSKPVQFSLFCWTGRYFE